MSKWDSGVNGIVEMLYNGLSYGVIHDGIASCAHFHDAFLRKLQLNSFHYISQKYKILPIE